VARKGSLNRRNKLKASSTSQLRPPAGGQVPRRHPRHSRREVGGEKRHEYEHCHQGATTIKYLIQILTEPIGSIPRSVDLIERVAKSASEDPNPLRSMKRFETPLIGSKLQTLL
jgi:hypothetical protein